jgi:uncharacterized membrane protein YeaQ/YmgE (transglycosylase-associated protein family)
MNPTYGIFLWIIIGGLAGWVASMIMGTNARQGTLANIVVGVIGATIGGFLSRVLFADERANNGLIASFGVALVGASLLIALWKLVARRVA